MIESTERNSNFNRLEIQTVFGVLFAERSGDSTYPGICICIDTEGEDANRYERQIILVECTPDSPKEGAISLRALVWGDEAAAISGGDYSDDYCIMYSESDAGDKNEGK